MTALPTDTDSRPDSRMEEAAAAGRTGAGAGGSLPVLTRPVDRTIVLVGLMGAGKSCIGKRLGSSLRLPFTDADKEIEAAAGCSISDIFTLHGEKAFREGERRVIQ